MSVVVLFDTDILVIDMRLIFEGQAIADISGDIRFVGQHDDGGQPRIVICLIKREALIARCQLIDPNPAELLAAYRSVSNEVNMLAAAQYAGGITKPIIDSSDLTKSAA